jgi:hypothetical protein
MQQSVAGRTEGHKVFEARGSLSIAERIGMVYFQNAGAQIDRVTPFECNTVWGRVPAALASVPVQLEAAVAQCRISAPPTNFCREPFSLDRGDTLRSCVVVMGLGRDLAAQREPVE